MKIALNNKTIKNIENCLSKGNKVQVEYNHQDNSVKLLDCELHKIPLENIGKK